jgi:uncharacterized protein YxeA
MKKIVFFACCMALIVSVGAAVAQNFSQNSQSSFVQSESNSESGDDMNSFSSFSSQQSSSNSSSYQQSTLSLSAENLNQPHILSINSSGNQLNGEITVNGRAIKRFTNNKVEIDLSPYLSVGEQKVQISARYAPVGSAVNVQVSGPGTNVIQQTNGDGVLNSTINLSVH